MIKQTVDQKRTYYLIENDRHLDVMFTQEQVEARMERGWRLVRAYTDNEWADVADAANDYAAQ